MLCLTHVATFLSEADMGAMDTGASRSMADILTEFAVVMELVVVVRGKLDQKNSFKLLPRGIDKHADSVPC